MRNEYAARAEFEQVVVQRSRLRGGPGTPSSHSAVKFLSFVKNKVTEVVALQKILASIPDSTSRPTEDG